MLKQVVVAGGQLGRAESGRRLRRGGGGVSEMLTVLAANALFRIRDTRRAGASRSGTLECRTTPD